MTRKSRLQAKVAPYAALFSVLADKNRLAILFTLAQRSMDVREIIDITGISGPLMSHHLQVLFMHEWVKKKKYGKRIEYSITLKHIHLLQQFFEGTPASEGKI